METGKMIAGGKTFTRRLRQRPSSDCLILIGNWAYGRFGG